MHLLKNTVLLLILLQVSLFAQEINLNSLSKSLSNKHLLIFLHTTDCGYCESMIEFTFDDKSVKNSLKNNFVFVDIDVKDSGTVIYKDFKGSYKEFAEYLGRAIYPSNIFIDANNQNVYAVSGYRDEDSFSKTLHYVENKSYLEKGHK